MTVNNHVLGNNPIWTSETQTRKVDFSAAVAIDTKTFTATGLMLDSSAHVSGGSTMIGSISHMCISNKGPVNIFVGSGDGSDLTEGVMVQPGGSFSFALDSSAQITVSDSTKTAVFSVLMFQ